MRKRVVAGLLGCLVAMMLAGSAVAGDRNTLNVGFYIEPTSLDPHIVTSTDVYLIWNMYEPLVGLRRDTVKLEPKTGHRVEISNDQKTYVQAPQGCEVPRRLDVHGGLGEDLHRADHPAEARGVLAALLGEGGEGARRLHGAGDPVQPDIAFQRGLPFIYMISAAAVKAREQAAGDTAPTWFADHSAGTGPYKIESWARGDKLVMTKFDDYWQGWNKPHVSKVIYYGVLEPGTQRLMVEKGDLIFPRLPRG